MQISRDTLDSHESADYPPMIKVDIKPIPNQTSSPPPSSHIEVEVLGVSEKRLFMLAPTAPATRKSESKPQHIISVQMYSHSPNLNVHVHVYLYLHITLYVCTYLQT